MNNIIKGSIAGATGVALLMGGFGTYAVWTDSEDLASNGVTSGALTIDTDPGVYDDLGTTGSGNENDWDEDELMVPGDEVSYTQEFTVTGTGKNLEGTIALATENMTNGFGAGNLTRTVDVTVTDAGTATITKVDATNFSFASPFDTATLTAVVTYTFDDVSGTTDQGKTATTPASTFTIAQS